MAPDFATEMEDHRWRDTRQRQIKVLFDRATFKGEHPGFNSWHRFFVETYFPKIEQYVIEDFWPDDAGYINLLDTLEAWLMNGNSVEVCGSYENYLLIACTVLQQFANREFRIPAFTDDPYEIRHVAARTEHLVVSFVVVDSLERAMARDVARHDFCLADIRDGRWFAADEEHGAAWRHPALGRSTWDLAVVAHARRTANNQK